MDISFFIQACNDYLMLPSTFVFLGVALFLTLKTRFIQVRAFPRFIKLLTGGVKKNQDDTMNTINPFHALFTAMSTTLGMGNIVGPSVAVITGGPGALFWLVVYAFFSSVTKYTEVCFALFTRKKTEDGEIIGGPTQYLSVIHPLFSSWYGIVTIFLFAGWSGLQANTLANIFYLESVPKWITGVVLAVMVFIILRGGIQRIGLFASKLVPTMCVLYLAFACLILIKNYMNIIPSLFLIRDSVFSPAAPVGGFIGATIYSTMRSGVYRSIYITESGLGTSSIPHSVADTDKPYEQGILAMFSLAADAFLSLMSGLIVLVTGVWTTVHEVSNTLMYQAFKAEASTVGKWILIISVTLFVLTTVIGNSFNGSQSFASFTRHRGMTLYHLFLAGVIFFGALVSVPIVWACMDILLTFVALPNLIGVILLTVRYPEVISYQREVS